MLVSISVRLTGGETACKRFPHRCSGAGIPRQRRLNLPSQLLGGGPFLVAKQVKGLLGITPSFVIVVKNRREQRQLVERLGETLSQRGFLSPDIEQGSMFPVSSVGNSGV